MVKYWHFYLKDVFYAFSNNEHAFFACLIVALLLELWQDILLYVVFYYAESEMT